MAQQVFISYKSQDGSWAERVGTTLESFGIPLWRDQTGIRLAEQWKPEIEAAIGQSTAMVVLWSRQVVGDANSIVHQEMQAMKQVIERDRTRRFISLVLDDAAIDRSPVLGPYQAETALRELYARAGPNGAQTIGEQEWYSAMLRVIQLLGVKDVIEAPYVVGAMTREQARQLRDDPDRWAEDEEAWKAFQALRKKTSAFDPEAYGEHPDEWMPYSSAPGSVSIGELISRYDRARREYEIGLGRKPKWVLVSYSDAILSADPQVRTKAQAAMNRKCLTVIDPVSLLHRTVYRNLVSSWGLQGRANTFVIGLSTCHFEMHADFQQTIPDLNDRMRNLLDAAYYRFTKPYEERDQFVLDVGNPGQLARWLQVAADAVIAAEESMVKYGSIDPTFQSRLRSMTGGAPGSRLVAMGQESDKG